MKIIEHYYTGTFLVQWSHQSQADTVTKKRKKSFMDHNEGTMGED